MPSAKDNHQYENATFLSKQECGIIMNQDNFDSNKALNFIRLILKDNTKKNDDELRSELIRTIKEGVGPIAIPEQIYFVSKLPKTRSGKIMRRLLKSIARNDKIGDISTLEDGAAVEEVQTAFNELQKVLKKNKN